MSAEPPYVPAMPPTGLMTAEELLQISIPDKRVELVRGRLVVREPPGFRHGRVTMELASRLQAHLKATDAAQVLVTESGFALARNPDTVRGPDLAVVSRDRIPSPEPRGFAEFPADLVVEILSPGNRPGETLAKVADWISGGARLVWVIDLERRLARVYRHDGTEQIVSPEEVLSGEDVVPGFSCPLSALL